eukprot:CAMPEP_0168391472 /NCGR_PEP_ID=MMETSP0228-20121227/18002_1 /TAXON_ID=133427 /ORGANISM="Protoceratium reticulatum, Strain CCCM 535 (=CCMP 1889)" /LENGTH=60 /DNA_ID=CAMNT_0008404787 /DNA_START=39 /DNA_END=218 /DNA_ORIENTATION=+
MHARGMDVASVADILGIGQHDVIKALMCDAPAVVNSLLFDPHGLTCPLTCSLMEDPVVAE